jgi:hypothetical protein
MTSSGIETATNQGFIPINILFDDLSRFCWTSQICALPDESPQYNNIWATILSAWVTSIVISAYKRYDTLKCMAVVSS